MKNNSKNNYMNEQKRIEFYTKYAQQHGDVVITSHQKSQNVYFITVNNINNNNDDVEVCTFINKHQALKYARSLVNAGYYDTININQRNNTTIPLKQWKRVNQKYVVVFDNMYPNMGRQSIVTRRNIFDVIEKYSNL